MAIRSGKISAIAAAVVHIFALRPFAFIVINVASFSSRRRASLAQDFTKPMFIIVLPERKPPRQGQRGCRKMGWLAAPARALIVRNAGWALLSHELLRQHVLSRPKRANK
jgi:hypothetical protein